MKILVTGSGGLIGGQAVEHFSRRGHEVIGIDNNMREYFFGAAGSTDWNRDRLLANFSKFIHYSIDIREMSKVRAIFADYGPFDAVIHCAAQPAHDWAAKEPLVDFAVNATGTLNMLEATRLYNPNAHFIFTSTSKVYGTVPNETMCVEYETRYDHNLSWKGFTENTRIDHTLHSVFGASKVAADIMAQEYGRYFGLKTTIFRPGCLTGPTHSAVELHGFLSYLVKCIVKNKPYTVFGYKAKQVRDNIHSYDVVRAFEEVMENPNAQPGEVYNLGGGRCNSISMIEAIEEISKIADVRWQYNYSPTVRIGDHQCWITDNTKFERAYPNWSVTRGINEMLREMVTAEKLR